MPACRPLPCRERALTGLAFVLAAALAFAGFMREARAETHDTCAGFIDSVPTVIASQGVWCLRHDVSTAVTSGNAIEIATNNVTIDCNGFKIGGLGAGDASTTYGIHAFGRQNITVRNCSIRGFLYGISLASGAGHLVEDNRLDGNLYVGINVSGDNSLVQRNQVFATGGATGIGSVPGYGIFARASVIDNLVDGVDTTNGTYVVGIRMAGPGEVARGNIVRNLVPAGGSEAYGIMAIDGVSVQDNHLYAGDTTPTGVNGYGFRYGAVCTGNTVYGFSTPYGDCDTSAGNAP